MKAEKTDVSAKLQIRKATQSKKLAEKETAGFNITAEAAEIHN